MRKPRNHGYITLSEASVLTGASQPTLYYHARAGRIRFRYGSEPGGRGTRRRLLLQIDDVRLYSWPRLGDLARRAGMDRRTLYYLIQSWCVPGIVRFGATYRVDPNWLPTILAWLEDGRRVRLPFVPREDSGS